MKYKLKLLFIGIALSFFIGKIFPNALFTPEADHNSFGTWTETAYLYNDTPELEVHLDESPHHLPQDIACTSRHLSTSKRVNNPSSSFKNTLNSFKGKEWKKSYTLSLSTTSTWKHSSRLTEARQHLISLRRLLI